MGIRREARRKRLRRAQRRLFIADAGGPQLVATAWTATTDWERRHLGGAWEGTGQWLVMPPPGRRLSQSGCALGVDWERRHLGGA